jgi:arylsulfatase A-like enzyme
VGCFGSKYYETPNIDKLAAGGMKFTNGYAACAV